ncbi:hypothetical protein AEM42_14675 [Betaproteobacteria bacterium UKL13-2]|nr:hypothetical protein AEM42_14675 [Betaproteobacteria bacterium UKL13-2]HCG54503.1 hypothetical protein [Betaproteobacteria bacterium]
METKLDVKFLSAARVREAQASLSDFHVFFGTTLLVFLQNDLPINSMAEVALDAENKQHLRKYFRLHPRSDYFFIPFKAKKLDGHWRGPKYASTSLQAINTQAFSDALDHERGTRRWAWRPDFLSALAEHLPPSRRLPLVDFAVWFMREEGWQPTATIQNVVVRFVKTFHLDERVVDRLFEPPPLSSRDKALFSERPVGWEQLIEGYGVPPDVLPESGAILQYLAFEGIGPTKRMSLHPGSRLNIFTGDNGLGKTFLLDIIWWALTREWPDHVARPLKDSATPPTIQFSVSGHSESAKVKAVFDSKLTAWKVPKVSALSGLVIYARVDGSFAIWDPLKRSAPSNQGLVEKTSCVSLTRESVWNGNDETEGLLRDVVRWQTRANESSAFKTFERILQHAKPPDLKEFAVGRPVRVPGWTMEVPTIIHPYGEVPIVYESAGVKRILTLAYLIVWAWEEHRHLAKLQGRREERQMAIIIDEAESHLHPKWQRVLLKSLLQIANDLHEDLSIQYFLATHSPTVLASAEPIWDTDSDRLFHLQLNDFGSVELDELAFEIRGSSDAWLLSPSFDATHPGSTSAEEALAAAKALMDAREPTVKQVRDVTSRLAQYLSPEDPFWLRWVIFANVKGVEI